MFKRFLEWIQLKEKIHFKQHKPPFVNEGEIWWVILGDNVGFEINGKSHMFTRPVIVLKKFSSKYFFVIPATTKKKTGTWYFQYISAGMTAVACLQHGRSIDYRRFCSKLGQLELEEFHQLKQAFFNLYK